jgi:hypothetical protein
MGKIKSRRSEESKPSRNVPLAQQIEQDSSVRQTGRQKKRNRNDEDDSVNSCIIALFTTHAARDNYNLVLIYFFQYAVNIDSKVVVIFCRFSQTAAIR